MQKEIRTLEDVVNAMAETEKVLLSEEEYIVKRITEINAVVKYIRDCKFIPEDVKPEEIARITKGSQELVAQLISTIPQIK